MNWVLVPILAVGSIIAKGQFPIPISTFRPVPIMTPVLKKKNQNLKPSGPVNW
jgi:hypothetical protein